MGCVFEHPFAKQACPRATDKCGKSRKGKGKGDIGGGGWGKACVPAGEAIVQRNRSRGPRALGLDKVGSDGRAAVIRFHPRGLERQLGLALVCCCFGGASILLLGRGGGRGGLGAFPGKDGVHTGLGGPYYVVQVADEHACHRVGPVCVAWEGVWDVNGWAKWKGVPTRLLFVLRPRHLVILNHTTPNA